MIRDRLKKLEKLAAEAMANCPGCVRIGALILVPSLITDESASDQAVPDESARCEVCGKVQLRPVIRICVPGLAEPFVALD